MAGVDGGNGGALPPATETSMKSSIVPIAILALATATVSSAAFAQHHGKQHRGQHHGQHHFGGGIASLDVDADGRISRSEIADKGRRSAMLEKHFDTIDANRDGHIVRTELRAWHERPNERKSLVEGESVCVRVDPGGRRIIK